MTYLRKKHVAHLSSVHQPGDVRIVRKECTSLVEAGYSVEFIVPCDQEEVMNGVVVHGPKRPASRMWRFLCTVPAVFWRAVQSRAAICHFHDPELIPVAILLVLMGRKVVYDVHEDLPQDILTKRWVPQRLRKAVARCSSFAEAVGARFFNGIVAATPGIAERFPRGKTATVCNYPVLGELDPPAEREFSHRSRKIVYVGGITAIRGAEEMVIAAEKAWTEAGVKLELAGPFDPPELADKVQDPSGDTGVQVLGTISREGVRELLADCRAGIVVFHPGPNHNNALPNKLFEYMAAGVPVVASDFPLWAKVVGEADCGVLVDPLDPEAIAEAMMQLVNDPDVAGRMGQNGAKAVASKFSWEVARLALLGMYESLSEYGANPLK